MPTAEGTFPKIGGDPLYFSEANRLGRAPQVIANQIFPAISGTAPITLGSWLLPVGSFIGSTAGLINMHFMYDTLDGGGGASNQEIVVLRASGAKGNFQAGIGSNIGPQNAFGELKLYLTNTSGIWTADNQGWSYARAAFTNAETETTMTEFVRKNGVGLLGSPFVLFLDVRGGFQGLVGSISVLITGEGLIY